MNGIRPPQKYSELLSARMYLNNMLIDETDEDMILIIKDLKASLDQYFINQLSTFEHQIDINYPIV